MPRPRPRRPRASCQSCGRGVSVMYGQPAQAQPVVTATATDTHLAPSRGTHVAPSSPSTRTDPVHQNFSHQELSLAQSFGEASRLQIQVPLLGPPKPLSSTAPPRTPPLLPTPMRAAHEITLHYPIQAPNLPNPNIIVLAQPLPTPMAASPARPDRSATFAEPTARLNSVAATPDRAPTLADIESVLSRAFDAGVAATSGGLNSLISDISGLKATCAITDTLSQEALSLAKAHASQINSLATSLNAFLAILQTLHWDSSPTAPLSRIATTRMNIEDQRSNDGSRRDRRRSGRNYSRKRRARDYDN